MTYRVVLKSKVTGRVKTIWAERGGSDHSNRRSIMAEYGRKYHVQKIVEAS